MKTILGRIATFVSGTIAGFIGFGIFAAWCDMEDDSFILNVLPNARQRYNKDVKAAREEGIKVGAQKMCKMMDVMDD